MGGIVQTLLSGFAPAPKMPAVPDYEAERKKAEADALKKRREEAEMRRAGMAATILGGAKGGEDMTGKKKLLGE